MVNYDHMGSQIRVECYPPNRWYLLFDEDKRDLNVALPKIGETPFCSHKIPRMSRMDGAWYKTVSYGCKGEDRCMFAPWLSWLQRPTVICGIGRSWVRASLGQVYYFLLCVSAGCRWQPHYGSEDFRCIVIEDINNAWQMFYIPELYDCIDVQIQCISGNVTF